LGDNSPPDKGEQASHRMKTLCCSVNHHAKTLGSANHQDPGDDYPQNLSLLFEESLHLFFTTVGQPETFPFREIEKTQLD
jgi:hypothetical protein